MYDFDLGLKCKCLTITNGSIIDYPIVSSSITEIKKCELCDLEANKYCVKCQELYCKSCSKVTTIISNTYKNVF